MILHIMYLYNIEFMIHFTSYSLFTNMNSFVNFQCFSKFFIIWSSLFLFQLNNLMIVTSSCIFSIVFSVSLLTIDLPLSFKIFSSIVKVTFPSCKIFPKIIITFNVFTFYVTTYQDILFFDQNSIHWLKLIQNM